MKTLVILILGCLLFANAALALIDDWDDSMGVYFDLAGDSICRDCPFNSIANAYVLYTNPTVMAIYGFEARITVANSDGFAFTPIFFPPTLPQGGVIVGNNGNRVSNYSSPLLTSPATLIVTISWFNLEVGTTNILIGPSLPSSGSLDLPMVILDDYSLMHTGMSSLAGTPCAQLNAPECMVVGTDEMSWDSVKSLYR